jgi:hypothetical protein
LIRFRVLGALAIGPSFASAFSQTAVAAPDGPGPVAVVAEQDRKSIAAVRTERPPRIDGRLDDPAWAAATPDDRFTQAFPAERSAPTYRTEVRVLYDDEAIYVGVRLHDPHPEAIVARLTRRDRIPESDAVIVRLDSQHDHATAFVFRLHASGVQYDHLFYDDGNGTSPEWDAVWAGEVSIDDGGWSAEYRIPLGALRFAGLPEETWGLQVVRYVSRSGERDVWSYWPSSLPGEVSHYDHLVGLKNLRSPRTFELRPYLLGRLRGQTPQGTSFLGGSEGTVGERVAAGDAGVDLKVGLTSDLTLDLSLNPDFGQVEADQVVLNLSRFETFFPEKRPFFLEGTDLFRTPIQLFYSRRIGRPPIGFRVGRTFMAGPESLKVSEAPASLRLWTAGKLSGKLSRDLSVAAVGAMTDAETVSARNSLGAARRVQLSPLRAYSVLRTRYALGGPSYLGLMGTGVSRIGGHLFRAADDHDAYGGSMDGLWQSRGAEWRVSGQAVVTKHVRGPDRTTSSGSPCPEAAPASACLPIMRADGTVMSPGALGSGGTLRLSHVGTHLIQEAALDVLSPELDPNDAGFLPDYNKRQATAKLGYQDTQPGQAFRSVFIFLSQSAAEDFSRTRVGTRTGLDLSGLLANFSSISAGVSYEWPDTWDTRETYDGARFERPPRADAYFVFSTDARRSMGADLSLSYGRAVGRGTFTYAPNGTYWTSASASFNLRPLPQLELALAPGLGWQARDLRFQQCTDDAGAICTVQTRARHYHFAALDSGSLSLVLRATLALTPRLSLQTYGQLFMAQGTFSDYRVADAVGPLPFLRRADLRPTVPAGDTDGDGIKDDDFEQVSLSGNVVLRWEPWPGSTFFLVYTRNQAGSPALRGMAPGFNTSSLASSPTEDILALKFVYYWTP